MVSCYCCKRYLEDAREYRLLSHRNVTKSWDLFSEVGVVHGGRRSASFWPRNTSILIVDASQETKCTKMSQLEDSIIHVEGYESFWSFSTVKSGYSGVATYVKKGKTLEASITPFEDTRLNHEGRTVMTDHKNFVLFNCYFPNAGQVSLTSDSSDFLFREMSA